jgi:acetyltransferase-like isoleucine patch superfamily enzyme
MLSLGENTDIGAMTYLQCKYGITIGENVKIGSHCSIYSEDTIGGHSGPVIIMDGCRVGSHSLIMPNIILGKGIIVPAYSFVKKSILSQEDLDSFLIRNSKKPFDFGGLL